MIYLDYTANMPVEPRVLEAFCEAENRFIGNANARHGAGREAAGAMARAAEACAELLGVRPEEVIFNSGASEGNNTAIMGIAHANRHVGRHIITTPLEHASVSGCLTALQERGWEIDVLDVDRDGTMPKLHSRNFPGMELIRPLYRVHEEDIIAWKNAHELSFIQCACRFTENCTLCDNGGGGSKRQEVKQLLKRLNRDGGKVEKNVFNAIHMLQFDTFPGWKQDGVAHSFLETYDDVSTTVDERGGNDDAY